MIFQEVNSQLSRENERLKNEFSQKSQICATSLESSSIFPEWECFEFLTKKNGASGPSKIECLSYYSEKYDFLKLNKMLDRKKTIKNLKVHGKNKFLKI